MIQIGREEFVQRIEKLQAKMAELKLDALLVYGDEYRKENLRYVCNFWPIFERAACIVPSRGEPILVGAPEGERYAREMCVWDDVRLIKDFACVSVPEEIDFPLANFSALSDIFADALGGGSRLGMVGMWDIPGRLMDRFVAAAGSAQIVDADEILIDLRIIKTPAEIACLREAGRMACAGYEELIAACTPGNTELHAAGAAEGAARQAGAEDINFTVMGTGPRVDTVIGRPTTRIIEDGDMVMAALAVQYEGYVATVEFPFVAGTPSDAQKSMLSILLEAANVQLEYLKDGVISGDMVRAVRDVFRKRSAAQFDIYPPMHGIGLAEAESPYPDESATYALRAGMCVNSDISLWGHPGGSNRIEEGFIITATGPESITPYIRKLCAEGL